MPKAKVKWNLERILSYKEILPACCSSYVGTKMSSGRQHPGFFLCKTIYQSSQCIMKSWLLISLPQSNSMVVFLLSSMYKYCLLLIQLTVHLSSFFSCLTRLSFCTLFPELFFWAFPVHFIYQWDNPHYKMFFCKPGSMSAVFRCLNKM